MEMYFAWLVDHWYSVLITFLWLFAVYKLGKAYQLATKLQESITEFTHQIINQEDVPNVGALMEMYDQVRDQNRILFSFVFHEVLVFCDVIMEMMTRSDFATIQYCFFYLTPKITRDALKIDMSDKFSDDIIGLDLGGAYLTKDHTKYAGFVVCKDKIGTDSLDWEGVLTHMVKHNNDFRIALIRREHYNVAVVCYSKNQAMLDLEMAELNRNRDKIVPTLKQINDEYNKTIDPQQEAIEDGQEQVQ